MATTTMSVITRVALVLSVAPASCGARTGVDNSGNDGAPSLGMFGNGGSTSASPGAPSPTALPCTGSSTREAGDGEQERTGPCRWHEAEPADLAHPDLTFTTNEKSIALTLVDDPAGCETVSGRGWYLVANVPGVIVEAPVVMTFEVCAAACKEIVAGEGWLLSFNVNNCPH